MASKRLQAITLQAVAEASGVTPMAASVALHGTGGGRIRVSEETRVRIQATAARLGYRPNRLARSLQSRRSGVIGLYTGHTVFNADSTFTAQLLAGIQQGCARHHRDLLLHRGTITEDESIVYREIDDGLIEGALVRSDAADAQALSLAQGDLPAVAVADPLPGMPSVTADNAAGGRLLAEHLLQRGHRHVVWQGGQAHSQQIREQAFVHTVQAAGATVQVFPQPVGGGLGEPAANVLTPRSRNRATAVACYADHAAWAVLHDLRSRGWTVPHQVALCGFDGINLFGSPIPIQTLTTVHANWRSVGTAAVDALVARIQGETLPDVTLLPVVLYSGETT